MRSDGGGAQSILTYLNFQDNESPRRRRRGDIPHNPIGYFDIIAGRELGGESPSRLIQQLLTTELYKE